jgi:para-aminobenzoate synthetase component 1
VDTGASERRRLPDVPRRPDGRVDLDRVSAALRPLHDGRAAALLESAPGVPHTGRWSYVVAGVAGTWRHSPHLRGVTERLHRVEVADDPFVTLDRIGETFGLTPDAPRDPDEPPFSGGLLLALSYDAGRAIESLPSHADADRDVDHVDARLVDAVVAVDHRDETAWLVRPAWSRTDPDDVAAPLRTAPVLPPVPTPDPRPATTSLPRDRYLDAVRTVLEHIAAGDAFQVNLTQRLTAHWPYDLLSLYRALRDASGAPYGAVVPTGRAGGIASISPETFLHADGRRVETRPIKGTRPRAADAAADATRREELVASAKDRAENVMVVDMERNDLGRVCVPGTVRVPDLLTVEAHPTVWHLVSTVRGELREGVGYGGLLRAAFPCGSVTGTPKVAAMRIIERLEPVRRAWYCGAIGFVAPGALSTSVAIRTATLHHEGTVDYGAGGGIVADSDPDAEWDESLAKAAAFLRAVGASPPR